MVKNKPIENIPVKYTDSFDKAFCISSKKYSFPKLLLKSFAIIESDLNPNSYRFEKDFWTKYLQANPDWMDEDPKEVSASYGLMQLMYTTAWMLGFRGKGEELYNPMINIELGAKYLRRILDKMEPEYLKHPDFSLRLMAARYNAGPGLKPNEGGTFRNDVYVNKVFAIYHKLIVKEKECE